jgi:hypothetical protein
MFCFQRSPSFDTWCEFHIIFFKKKNLAKGNAYNPHYKKNMFLVENCFFFGNMAGGLPFKIRRKQRYMRVLPHLKLGPGGQSYNYLYNYCGS